jgi:hypothetical protein
MKALLNRVKKLEVIHNPDLPEIHTTFVGSDDDEKLNRLGGWNGITNPRNVIKFEIRFIKSDGNGGILR